MTALTTTLRDPSEGLSTHVGLRSTLSQTMTMAWRATMKMRRNFEQLFDVTIQPLLFTAMFAGIFGGAISGSVAGYLPVIIPGLVGQTVLTACVATGVQLREDMDKGVFERFKVLPIARIAPLAGPMVADMLRYAIASTLTFGTGIVLGYRPGGGVPGVLAAIVLADGDVPAHVPVQRVRADLDDAPLPGGVRERQPGLPHHLGDPRPGQRRPGDRPGRLGAVRLRRRGGDLRPAVGPELQPEDVSPASASLTSPRSSRLRRPSYASTHEASRPGAAASAYAASGSQPITGNQRL